MHKLHEAVELKGTKLETSQFFVVTRQLTSSLCTVSSENGRDHSEQARFAKSGEILTVSIIFRTQRSIIPFEKVTGDS